MDDLLAWRSEFPILERVVYLINNSLGAMPRQTRQKLGEYADLWDERGVEAWKDSWWDLPRSVGDQIGRLIGAQPGSVSIQPNVTTAEWVALSSIPRDGRKKIVYSELNFPSVRYFYQAQDGLEIEVVPCPDGMTVPLDQMLEAIDHRTLAVPISHVIFKSSYIQNVTAIIEKAHRVGAYVILDVYHSAGVLPFSVAELGVDFAVGGVLKWLCGGPGVGFLYIRPDLLRSLSPSLTGWLAHERPFEFSPNLIPTETSYRFMSGTPNIPGLYAAQSGLDVIARIGIERIRTRSLKLTELIIQLANELAIPICSPQDHASRGGHVTLAPQESERVYEQLLERGLLVDFRPGSGIRVAPHFFNTEAEVEAVIEAMADIGRSMAAARGESESPP